MGFNRSGQHFLLSKELRDFTAWDVAQMDEEACLWKVVDFRWGCRDKVICPSCGSIQRPYVRVSRGQLRCRDCDHHFSPLYDTPFEDRKLPFKKLLLGISLFVASAKGVPALLLARLLDIQNKTATVFTGKLREALVRQRDMEMLVGTIEIDGGHFCGKPRQGRVRLKTRSEDVISNLEAKMRGEKKPRRKARNAAEARNWARRKLKRIVMVLREQHTGSGNGASKTRIGIGYTENSRVATQLTKKMVTTGAIIMTDENTAYTCLASDYEHKRVEHAVEFSTIDGVNENQAESYFSRLRRAEYGTYHGFRPKYLFDYAQEFAWREDVRRLTESEKLADLFGKIFSNGLSRWWRGYWQGYYRSGEYGLVS